jgi:hypothetical protein
MGQINLEVDDVNLIIGIIFNKDKVSDPAVIENRLTAHFGKIDIRSELVPFKFTEYYNKEMGHDLIRYWISFADLIPPDLIVPIKHKTNAVELEFANPDTNDRFVNLDPGYLNAARLVLVSTKDFSHRVYLGKGIYGEITLLYKKKQFHKLDWSYPDYYSEPCLKFLEEVRSKYMSGFSKNY